MRYGFKAQAERDALDVRTKLHLKPFASFDPFAYAKFLDVIVIGIEELELSRSCKKQLLNEDSGSWSGMTLREGAHWFIVINPTHVKERQVSTLMHELAHIILKHVPAKVNLSEGGHLMLSEFSKDDEDEADWLAGTFLLPRDVLFEKREKKRSFAQIAADMGVSKQLCEWRARMTGVDAQLKRRKQA